MRELPPSRLPSSKPTLHLTEAGEVAAAGTISEPEPESFTVETLSGQTVTVEVPVHQFENDEAFTDPNQPATVIALSSDPFPHVPVESGDHVVVFGNRSGATVTLTKQVLIFLPGETPPDLREFVATGVVQGNPSGESFTIETAGESTGTVEISPSTTYRRVKPLPDEQVHPAALAPGDYVGIIGSISGATAEATGVVISTPQAGGHPDLTTSFELEAPGAPEAAQNVVFNAPTGVFGNPRAITQCIPADFALDQCPPDAQVGLVTLHANYEGNHDYLLGTAPIFAVSPEEGETARFSFLVPVLDIPISIPVQSARPPTTASASPSKTSPSSLPWPPPSSPSGASPPIPATKPSASPRAPPGTPRAAPKKSERPAIRRRQNPATPTSR